MQENGVFTWREVVEKHHSSLVDDLNARLDSELNGAISAAVAHAVSQATADEQSKSEGRVLQAATDARTSQVESLNQTIRRFRSASEGEVPGLLARSAAAFAEKMVVLLFENSQAHVAATHGIRMTPDAGAEPNVLKTEEIPAIMSAIESKDPVVALATPGEISSELSAMFEFPADGAAVQKTYLFPIVARQSVMAMLVASGVELSAPLELLSEIAGMRLESVAAAAKAPEQITPEVPASETSAPRSWSDLSPEDQKLHLQAQRTARVRVAEMRLFHTRELQEGTANSDIFGALREPIQKARDEFLQSYLSKSPTMVDYLHLEILRSLAHEDDRMLGASYPGPMV